jgi:hypothetical protein
MHDFSELANRCTVFTLASLKEVHEKTIEALQTSGATSLVKSLQMIRLEKTILAVGMFSIFDAILQDRLGCSNGFAEAKIILKHGGETELFEQFSDYELAINALKHGKGRSYNQLAAKDTISIKATVKKPDENFFFEGDVSEISGLVEVDDEFIENCSLVIARVSRAVQKLRPGVYF